MKNIIRSQDFGATRYKYDFGQCSVENGWAQVDTGQDASYFGTWINPTLRQTLCYCEGDATICQFDTDAELVAEMSHTREWLDENGSGFKGIDPGFSETLKARLISAGLASYLHPEYASEKVIPVL